MDIKYTSRAVTKTTVKSFDLVGAAPNRASWAKREFLPDVLIVTYEEGPNGLKRTRWEIKGYAILKDGSSGQQRADAGDWSVVAERDDLQSIADHNAPWVKR